MQTKIILDVDTGSDDAVAMMTALLSPAIQVEAICTVWGNLPVEDTTHNTIAVLEALNKQVPVYAGCSTAMVKYLSGIRTPNQRDYHPVMKDGKELRIHYARLEGLPEAKGSAMPTPASLFYVDYLNNTPQPVTIVAVGPLTNLGFALTIDPSIARNIKQIVVMGGGEYIANSTACSEANIWHDPEAAHKVVHCGAPVLMVPLDATHAAAMNMEDCRRLRSLNTFSGNFAANLIQQRIEFEDALFGYPRGETAVHDALAVCALINPDVLENVKDVHCEIGLLDRTEGQTIINHRRKPAPPNIRFAYSANHDLFADILCDVLSKEA